MTRQIVGVAAGTQDTDAVNVAQLKKLDTKVENTEFIILPYRLLIQIMTAILMLWALILWLSVRVPEQTLIGR